MLNPGSGWTEGARDAWAGVPVLPGAGLAAAVAGAGDYNSKLALLQETLRVSPQHHTAWSAAASVITTSLCGVSRLAASAASPLTAAEGAESGVCTIGVLWSAILDVKFCN